jgi:thiol-disulfide isomerase/thioredoxin
MKKYAIICWLLLALSCRGKTGGSIGSLPSFDLLLSDGLTHLNTSEIKAGKPVALLYFSPDCEHCQQETTSILHHMDSLRDVQFYFITNDSLDRAKTFRSVFQLDKYSNIILAWDNQFLFPRHFKGAFPPYLVLYDRQLRQLGAFDGEMEVSKLIALINN